MGPLAEGQRDRDHGRADAARVWMQDTVPPRATTTSGRDAGSPRRRGRRRGSRRGAGARRPATRRRRGARSRSDRGAQTRASRRRLVRVRGARRQLPPDQRAEDGALATLRLGAARGAARDPRLPGGRARARRRPAARARRVPAVRRRTRTDLVAARDARPAQPHPPRRPRAPEPLEPGPPLQRRGCGSTRSRTRSRPGTGSRSPSRRPTGLGLALAGAGDADGRRRRERARATRAAATAGGRRPAPVRGAGALTRAIEIVRPQETPNGRSLSRDFGTGLVEQHFDYDAGGTVRIVPIDLDSEDTNHTVYSIVKGDPLSARVSFHASTGMARDGWSARAAVTSSMRSDAEAFHVTGGLTAYENDEPVFSRSWETASRATMLSRLGLRSLSSDRLRHPSADRRRRGAPRVHRPAQRERFRLQGPLGAARILVVAPELVLPPGHRDPGRVPGLHSGRGGARLLDPPTPRSASSTADDAIHVSLMPSPYRAAAFARAHNEWLRERWLDAEPRLRGVHHLPCAGPTRGRRGDPRAAQRTTLRPGAARRRLGTAVRRAPLPADLRGRRRARAAGCDPHRRRRDGHRRPARRCRARRPSTSSGTHSGRPARRWRTSSRSSVTACSSGCPRSGWCCSRAGRLAAGDPLAARHELAGAPRGDTWLDRLPSEVAREHVRFTTQPLEHTDGRDELLFEMLEAVGAPRRFCSPPTTRTGIPTMRISCCAGCPRRGASRCCTRTRPRSTASGCTCPRHERRLDGAHKRAEAPALPAPGAGMSEWVVIGTFADLEAAGRLVARVAGREVGVVWDRERRTAERRSQPLSASRRPALSRPHPRPRGRAAGRLRADRRARAPLSLARLGVRPRERAMPRRRAACGATIYPVEVADGNMRVQV